MKTALALLVAVFSMSAMADRICGTVKNVSALDTDMISFSLSVSGETGWRVISVQPKDVDRIRPMVLTALSNPNITVCTQLSDVPLWLEMTNR